MIPRVERLKAILKNKGINSIILLHPANISYLTGFSTQDSYLFVNERECLFITDSRYSTEYRNYLGNSKIEILETNKKLPQSLKEINKRLKIKNLAFEQEYLSFSVPYEGLFIITSVPLYAQGR